MTRSLLTEAKERAFVALDAFDRADGVSGDPYHEGSTYHPMAEAKYLLALTELLDTRLVTSADFGARVGQAVTRLSAANVAARPSWAAWGLQFAWGEACAETPYTITTSIIVRALDACAARAAPGNGAARLAERGRAWLLEGTGMRSPEGAPALEVPVYSPVHGDRLVVNAVASWLAAVWSVAPQARRDAIAAWLIELRTSPFGWPYEPEGARVDLLHQGYILNALLEAGVGAKAESAAWELLGTFWGHGGLIDQQDLYPRAEGLAVACQASSVRLLVHGADALVVHPAPATRWAVGELLVCLVSLARRGEQERYWTAVCRQLLPELVARFAGEGQPGFRPLLHLTHGAAAVLSLIRGQR